MIAAGVNAKALPEFMGHSSITVTFDLYGHLMPDTQAEAAALLDTFIGAQTAEAERVAREADPVQASGVAGEQTGEHDPQSA